MSLKVDGEFIYNGEHHWFWAALSGEPPLERLRILHQAALDFLGWERGASPDKVSEALGERRAEVLRHAQKIHDAKQGAAFGVLLMTMDEYRADD